MSSLTMIPQDVSSGNKRKLDGDVEDQKPAKKSYMSKAREIRLEQNRKAARESRRRKKVMIEELQRSVIFFSRTNGALKQQNEELTRLLMQAEAQVSAIESKKDTPNSPVNTPSEEAKPAEETQSTSAQSDAQEAHVLAAARATVQLANGASSPTKAENPSAEALPQMQPGATMQAMANFQQAATAAMQAAVQGMQGNSTIVASPPAPARTQQFFTDTMAAIAMQQAAAATAAVAGQQFLSNPFMAPMLAWQNHQMVAAMAQAAAPASNPAPAPQIPSPKKE